PCARSKSPNESQVRTSTLSQESRPARLSCRSSNEKPSGFTKCNVERVARQRRPIFPVLGGISGSIRTTLNISWVGRSASNVKHTPLRRLNLTSRSPRRRLLDPPTTWSPRIFRALRRQRRLYEYLPPF